MLIDAFASGVAREARTPTSEKSNVPATRRHRMFRSHLTVSRTASWGQTTAVRAWRAAALAADSVRVVFVRVGMLHRLRAVILEEGVGIAAGVSEATACAIRDLK